MEKRKDKTAIIAALIIGFIAGLAAGRLFPRPSVALMPSGEEGTSGLVIVDNEDTGTDVNVDGTTPTENNIIDLIGNPPEPEVPAEILPTVSLITVSDQPAGSIVAIDKLQLEERSWAVVYEDLRGRPGNILGAHRYVAGSHEGVSVELQRPMEAGNVYYAMIHQTDEDDDFDFTKERPYTDETGTPLMVRFLAL